VSHGNDTHTGTGTSVAKSGFSRDHGLGFVRVPLKNVGTYRELCGDTKRQHAPHYPRHYLRQVD
jgi:hypothetical protein